MVQVDLTFTQSFLSQAELHALQPTITAADAKLRQRAVPGADYLGWLDLATRTVAGGTTTIRAAAKAIQDEADALVVIGIGGSYLGVRAAYEWLKPAYYNQLPRAVRGGPELYFAGNHISAAALEDLLRVLAGKRVYLNVISKSGTTTEPAIAFRILRAWLVEQVGELEAKQRIYVTTDASAGALKQLANAEGYPAFVVPDDVGGRYSVLTPVGLLPLAAIGVDVDALLAGAAGAEHRLTTAVMDDNPAYLYAAVRNLLYRKGKTTEILAAYEPALRTFGEWWKQLFGESEGKDQKGIFPASVVYTTDLHSMGQFVQEGSRNLFETVIRFEQPLGEMRLPSDTSVEDGLEYLSGKSLTWINDKARLATQAAHMDGAVPNLAINVRDKSERSLGELFYFFELACAMSGQLLGVNAFNQPGVEAYKLNMFALLGKPGYEREREALTARLE